MTQQPSMTGAGFHPASGYLLAACGAALFSMKAVFIKLAYGAGAAPAVDAITLLAVRMGFALPVYLFIGVVAWRERVTERRPLPSAQQFCAALAIGMLGYYCASYLDFLGLVYLTAQFERIILYTYPFFVMILGALFFSGRITVWSIGALLLAYAGIALIYAKGEIAGGDHALYGSFLVLVAAFCFALYQLLAKSVIARIGSRIFTCIAMSGACLAVLFHYMTQHEFAALTHLPVNIIVLGAFLGIVSTVLPSFMLNAALDRVGAEAVAVLGTLSPTATIIMAIVLLGEPFTLVDAAGTALVMFGVGLYTWRDTRQKKHAGTASA